MTSVQAGATAADVSVFQATLRGELIQPEDAQYDEIRALYNGMIDRRPALIARCVDVADVIAAVNFARERGLRVAVRGGGHNGGGLGSVDDGLVIDLRAMNGVRVNPEDRTARVEGGAILGDVDQRDHGHRGPHTGGWAGPPDPQVRAHHRQSAGSGRRAG